MNQSNNEEIDVLVVGAGPTGLTAACELARYGLKFRIIEKRAEPSDKSKALVVHARTLELLRLMGCADQFLQFGLRILGVNIYDANKRIAHLSLTDIDSPFQYALGIPQFHTERLLYEHLQSYKSDVERQTELLSISENSDHVTAIIRTAQGKEEKLRCKYLIACDGSHSSVRSSINESFDGGVYEELFQLADVKVNWEPNQTYEELFAFSSAQGNAAFFPMPGERWRVITVLPPGVPENDPTLEEIQANVDAVVPWKVTLSDPVWLSTFKVPYRRVKHYRHNRIFLAGDAAHCHSPVGGQGMNTGMQDVFNLVWKLALAVHDQASEELLNSYHKERHAVAEQLMRSVDLMSRVNFIRAPLAREIRNRLAPLLINQQGIRNRIESFITEIGINYRNSPVVAEASSDLLLAALPTPKYDDDPHLGQWFQFSHGPKAGDRAPEAHMTDCANGQSVLLSDLLKTGKHNLLLVSGDAADHHVLKNLCDIASDAQGKFGEFVDISLITPGEVLPGDLEFAGAKFLDTDYSVHERLGAGASCMYIIRPDAYVGYRCQPPDFAGVDEYFSKIIKL